MVSADTNWVFGTKEELTATFKAKNNTKEFLIMGVVVGFHGQETVGVEGDGMEPVLVFLGDDHSQGVTGSVGIEDELLVPIRCTQDRMCRTTLFQSQKGRFALRRPVPSSKFLGQIIQRSGNMRKTPNKSVVEIAKT
jgi:hypothetical protein